MSGLIVTGARGCTGRMVVERALAEARPVILVGRDTVETLRGGDSHRASHDGTAAGLAPLLGDARGFTLVHCAAKNSPRDALGDAEALIDGNLRHGFSVIEAARAAGCTRVLNFGSFWQFDSQGQVAPVNSYAAMKVAFQVLLDYAAAAHGLACITLILSDTYGEQDPRPKLIPQLCAAARDGSVLEMSEGTQKISPLHLDDVTEAVAVAVGLVADATAAGRHAQYFVMGPEVLTIRALVALFESATGRSVPIRWGARLRLARLPEAPFVGGLPLPGWAPGVGLADGLRRAMAAAG